MTKPSQPSATERAAAEQRQHDLQAELEESLRARVRRAVEAYHAAQRKRFPPALLKK